LLLFGDARKHTAPSSNPERKTDGYIVLEILSEDNPDVWDIAGADGRYGEAARKAGFVPNEMLPRTVIIQSDIGAAADSSNVSMAAWTKSVKSRTQLIVICDSINALTTTILNSRESVIPLLPATWHSFQRVVLVFKDNTLHPDDDRYD
jgi:hypothetical protein